MEKEITVEINTSYEELDKILKEKGFNIIQEYTINDTYMINKDIDLSKLSKLEILFNCVLVRDIIPFVKYLTYKYKEFDTNGNITCQKKFDCPIEDVDKAIEFMKAINYKVLFNLNDKLIVYANDKIELAVQLVDNHIYIEVEDNCERINVKFNSIEEMKNELDSYNLPYDKSNYFVKKAEIKLEEVLNND